MWRTVLPFLVLVAVTAALNSRRHGTASDKLVRQRRAPSSGRGKLTLNVSIVEEQPVGTAVINLQSVNGLPRDGRYQFFPQSEFFDVNASTGVVFTKSQIDRDSLCDDDNPQSRACCRSVDGSRTSPCALELTIMVESRGTQHLIPITITVRDLNDNSPSFTSETSTVSIKENQRAIEVPLPVATDRDVDVNDIQEYRLNVGNYSNIFELRCNPDESLRAQKPASGTCRRADRPPQTQAAPLRPVLFVRAQTDRERQDAYELQLIAVDGGSPPLSASITVHVLVADDNDHAPRFAHSSYNFNISESEQVGFEIGHVIATDNDTDKNAEIEYRIVSSHSRADEIFSIDNGVLRLNNQLDYDGMQQQYRFVVVASDGGQLSASTSVTVNVLDANDNQPRVLVHLVDQSSADKLLVIENESNMQRMLGMVEVFDADSDREGNNNNVTCATDSPFFQLVQQLVSNQPGLKRYAIYSRKPLDREEKDALDLTVSCADNGNPPLTAQSHVQVEVLDVNDNAPMLVGSSSFEISENSPPDTPIGYINATDADQPGTPNSTIVYRLTNDADSQIVSISQYTGELFSARRFDREERASYRFNVTLSDRGSPPLSATYEFTLQIRDVNDNAPIIRSATTSFNIREDLAPNSPVGRLEADDADERNTDNSRVRYRLLAGDDYFMLTESGDLFTRTALDREQTAAHLIVVNLTNYAWPQSQLSPSSTATIRIDLIDVKDSPPRFLSRSQPFANVSCYETRPVEIARFTAIDDDLDDTLSYSITHGNEQGHFAIDSTTGSIRLVPANWRCSPETLNVHKLHVAATDSTDRSSSTVLNVVVTHESGPKAIVEAGVLSSEAVKIVIVLICASLVLATAMIVVVLVFKVRPKRSSRYLETSPADDGVYPKRGGLRTIDADTDADIDIDIEAAENKSDDNSSSEDRYAAVIDDNNNGGARDRDREQQDQFAERARLTTAIDANNEKHLLDYDSLRGNRDSASRCSSLLAAVDNRSTLTRAADRELLYHTHAAAKVHKLQLSTMRPSRSGPAGHATIAVTHVDGAPLTNVGCECAACRAEYASVTDYPYAATLGRPMPPLPMNYDDNASIVTANPNGLNPIGSGTFARRADARMLPRRLASNVSLGHKPTAYKPEESAYNATAMSVGCGDQHLHAHDHSRAKHHTGDDQSVYADMLYCSACDALAQCCPDRLQHPGVAPVADSVVQINPDANAGRMYATQLQTRRPTVGSAKPLLVKSNSTKGPRTIGSSAFNQPSMDRSLTYVTPSKLTVKAKDTTYADHNKSSPYYSVSYV